MNEQMTQALAQALEGDRADPLQALLIQQLAQGNDGQDSSDLREELDRCRRAVQRLGAEVSAANAMTGWVAQVAGACPACWGLNRFCRRCLGAGAPGSSEPDTARLLDWIEPALNRAGLTAIPVREAGLAPTGDTEGASDGNG